MLPAGLTRTIGPQLPVPNQRLFIHTVRLPGVLGQHNVPKGWVLLQPNLPPSGPSAQPSREAGAVRTVPPPATRHERSRGSPRGDRVVTHPIAWLPGDSASWGVSGLRFDPSGPGRPAPGFEVQAGARPQTQEPTPMNKCPTDWLTMTVGDSLTPEELNEELLARQWHYRRECARNGLLSAKQGTLDPRGDITYFTTLKFIETQQHGRRVMRLIRSRDQNIDPRLN